MDLQLNDKVYVVTGATGGLGLATAQQLVADGARVVISGRDQARVDSAVATLGERATGVVADNGDEGTPAALVAAARAIEGTLAGLVISVGGPPPGAPTEVTDEQWTGAFETVFLGAVRLARTFAGELAEGGSITLVLSTSVREPVGGLTISNGLRPGLAMFAKTLANEVGPRGIRVNGLLPGRIDTDRVKFLDSVGGNPEQARAQASAGIPLGRYGTPEEFGRVAAFVASPAASFLTGVMVPVDGGAIRSL